MRLTLNIDDEIINEAVKVSGIKNRTYLINLSVNEYLKKLKRDKIKSLRGKINLDINIDDLRGLDILK